MLEPYGLTGQLAETGQDNEPTVVAAFNRQLWRLNPNHSGAAKRTFAAITLDRSRGQTAYGTS